MRYYVQFRGILDWWRIDPLANESSNFKKYRLKLLIVHFGRHCPIVVALIANPACLSVCPRWLFACLQSSNDADRSLLLFYWMGAFLLPFLASKNTK